MSEVKRMADETQQIAHDILAYLIENPDAQDTLKGIAEWWLSEPAAKQNIALVEEALAGLVQRGWVIARDGESALTYKVDRRRLKEITAFLAGFEKRDDRAH
jgi:hypothetical protein